MREIKREKVWEEKYTFGNEEQDLKEEAEKAAMRWHVVRSGDTLYGLALKNKTTVAEICRLNGISSKSVLRIGQKIRVR